MDHQRAALKRLSQHRAGGAAQGLVVMATGLGKTLTAAWDTEALLKTNPTARILILAHQRELLFQMRDRFIDQLDFKADDYLLLGSRFDGWDYKQARVCLGTYQSLMNELHRFKKNAFDLVIVDEAHHGPAITFQEVVSHFRPTFRLGLTATPKRGDAVSLEALFGKPIYELGLPEAMARGLLTPVSYHLMADDLVNLGSIDLAKKSVSIGEINRRVFLPQRDGAIAALVRAKMAEFKSKRTLVFCATNKHAAAMAGLLDDARWVHGRAKNRDQLISDFRDGAFSTLCTVDLFNEGMDVPEVDTIVFLRSTASETVFYQQLGRGLRKAPGKAQVRVLDFAGNVNRVLMLRDLKAAITQCIAARRSKSPKRKAAENTVEHEVLHSNFIEFDFDHTVIEIIDAIARSVRSWTAESILAAGVALAEELGRIPRTGDINKACRTAAMCSVHTLVDNFGTIAAFQKLLEQRTTFKARPVIKNRADIVSLAAPIAKRLGRLPTFGELKAASKDDEFCAAQLIYNHYETVAELHDDLLIELNWDTSNRYPRSREEVIAAGRELAQRLGEVPKGSDLITDGYRFPISLTSIVRMFGSYSSFQAEVSSAMLSGATN